MGLGGRSFPGISRVATQLRDVGQSVSFANSSDESGLFWLGGRSSADFGYVTIQLGLRCSSTGNYHAMPATGYGGVLMQYVQLPPDASKGFPLLSVMLDVLLRTVLFVRCSFCSMLFNHVFGEV